MRRFLSLDEFKQLEVWEEGGGNKKSALLVAFK